MVEFCLTLKGCVTLLCEMAIVRYKSIRAGWLFFFEETLGFVLEYYDEGQQRDIIFH